MAVGKRTEVRLVRRAGVDHGLVDRVRDLVREDARREARDDLVRLVERKRRGTRVSEQPRV